MLLIKICQEGTAYTVAHLISLSSIRMLMLLSSELSWEVSLKYMQDSFILVIQSDRVVTNAACDILFQAFK